MPYNPNAIEPKWQRWWDENEAFVSAGEDGRPKYYILEMFPYPSGKGLHVGHPACYVPGDIMARKRRAEGYNVLHPMGYDAFGLPAEQKAIDEGIAPQRSTQEAIENFRRQLKACGLSYDWNREVSTADPEYYRWTQWIFTKLYERGLAYEAETFVNWCPALGTVLANDEVIDGKSERGGHPVHRVRRKQWMLKITHYAEELLSALDELDWPEQTKTAQRERIGRSEGAEIDFRVEGHPDTTLTVFTTRPDTIFGATYMVMAPEHPLVDSLCTAAQAEAVRAYQKATAGKSEIARQAGTDKTGVDIGARAINPATGEAIPIWISDYVIYGYGTGAIMAVPAHDDRDWAFAKAMGLPVREVIQGGDVAVAAHGGEGVLCHSGPFDGVSTEGGEAVRKVTAWLEAEGTGRHRVSYRLRDWTFARQRYWGEPIPVLKRPDGTVHRALRSDELPVMLPEVNEYRPTGDGASPLSQAADWLNVEEAGLSLVRETDTMPGSAGSSWYFLRYCDPKNRDAFCDRKASDHWMPVDLYIGGPEHSVGHLLYARMWQRFLHELDLVRDPEPFRCLRHQGMIQAFTYYDDTGRVVPQDQVVETEEGAVHHESNAPLTRRIEKMSKRKGNVVNPDEVIEHYGADAMRVYICFLGPLEQDKPWAPGGVEAQWNWLKRLYRLYFDDADASRVTDGAASDELRRALHRTIKKVSEDIEKLAFNTAISSLHVFTRALQSAGATERELLEPLCLLLQPFAPHLSEELWQNALGHPAGVSAARWPSYDPALAKRDTVRMGVQILGKTRGEIELPPDAPEQTAVDVALAEPNVKRHVADKTVVKVIYRPGKILNLIIR